MRAALRSSTSVAFDVPLTRTEFGKTSFSVTVPSALNSLPPSLRQITDIGQFNRALKARLYGVAYKI